MACGGPGPADTDGAVPPDGSVPGDGDGGAAEGCPGLSPLSEPPEQLYVAADGSDDDAGTEAAPLASLAEAADRFPDGGTVIVRGGVYGPQRLDARGTTSHPLVIRAAAGEVPIFDGETITNSWSGVIYLWSAEHVVLQGLEIRNCRADHCAGIASSPVLDLSVRECHIHHVDGPAARFAGKTLRFEGNHFHDVALTNEDNTAYPEGGWPTCMGTTPDRDQPDAPLTDDVVIRNNRIEDCWGEGIGIWFASHVLVEGNVVDNAFSVGIYMDNSFDVVVSRNFVRVVRGRNGSHGSGILMGTEGYAAWGLQPSSSHAIAISNNVVVAGRGIGWWRSPEGTDANRYEGIDVLHNTVVATARSALGFAEVGGGPPPPSNCRAVNNVLAEVEDGDLGDPAAWSLAGNAWLDETTPPIAGPTDVAIDAAVGTVASAEDVAHLAEVVGSGEPGTGIDGDYRCRSRDATAPTRGAFEP